VNGRLHDLALTRLLTQAYHPAPVWDEVKYDIGCLPTGRPLKEVEVLAAEAVANRCPVVLRDSGAFERDPARAQAIGRNLKEMGRLLAARFAATPMKHCALIHSATSERLDPAGAHLRAVRGLHSFLIQHQIPCSIVTEETPLEDYAVAIVAETPRLAPAAVESLQRFVSAGSGLLGIGRLDVIALKTLFGLGGSVAQPLKPPQARAASPDNIPITQPLPGRFNFGRLGAGHRVVAGIENREVYFAGGYVWIEPPSDGQILADVLALSKSRMASRVYADNNLYPGDPVAPLLVVRGRTAYVSAMIAEESARARCEHLDVLLRQMLEWISPRPVPVRLENACPGVRVCLDRLPDDAGILLYFVNQSTSGFSSTALTWVCPLRGAIIHLKWPWSERPEIETLSGGPFKLLGLGSGEAMIEMKELNVHAACRIARK